jgi:hypothetical protein
MKSFKQFLSEKVKEHKDDHDEYHEVQMGIGDRNKKDHDEYHEVQMGIGDRNKKKINEEILIEATQISSLHKKLVKHYKNYDDNHEHYIKNYTSESSHINNKLWKKTILSSYEKKHIKNIDSVIKKHKTPKAMTVYSGLGKKHPLHDHLNKKNKKPIKLIHHAFTSTSLSNNVAGKFSHSLYSDKNTIEHRHVLKIHVPKGHTGAYVSHISIYPREKEFIMPRGTKLHVHPVPKTEKKKDGIRDIHVHTWTAHVA